MVLPLHVAMAYNGGIPVVPLHERRGPSDWLPPAGAGGVSV
jgi:hypothetical protein